MTALPRVCPRKRPRTFTEQSALLDHLNDIWGQRYALDNKENIEGACCAAMPVIEADPKVFDAVSLSSLASRIRDTGLLRGWWHHSLARHILFEINSKIA